MAKQKQDDQLEHTYSSYVRIRDVALKTCKRRWTIGRSGKSGSEISVLAARHDDDIYFKQYIHIYIYIYIYCLKNKKFTKFIPQLNYWTYWARESEINSSWNIISRAVPRENLLLGHLFFFNTCFWRFKSSLGRKVFVLMFPLVFIMETVLIGWWFLLISGFVFVNIHIDLIPHDKLLS